MADSWACIVTAIDETWSLQQTVETVIAENKDSVTDILIAIASFTTEDCRNVIKELEQKYPTLVRHYQQQKLAGPGGAIQECAALIDADWVVIMSSDLETPPENVKDMIKRSLAGDLDIVASSRWIKDGSFGNYSKPKLICNWIFQKFFGLLYQTKLTDMTYGYRAYKSDLLCKYKWQETGMAFFMESLVKPLRDKQRIDEIPVHWKLRQEGISRIRTIDFLYYFRIGLRTRCTSLKNLYAAPAKNQN